MYNIFKKYKWWVIILVKIIIITGAFYFIYKKLFVTNHAHNNNLLYHVRDVLQGKHWIIFVVLWFTISNWLLEIFKWKALVKPVKTITFFDALKQSTSSLTASFLTPNRIGEYGAKAIYYPKYYRKKIMFLNFIGNSSQMLITIIFGIFGIGLLSKYFNTWLDISQASTMLGLILAFFLFIVIYFFKYKTEFILVKKIKHFIQKTPIKQVKVSVIYSLLRYLVFSHQFYFLLWIFGVELDYLTAISAIFSMYFIASVIPSFVVFDFIVKGSVAITVFGLFQVDEFSILAITTTMWMLNFAVPSIIGSYYVLTFEYPKTEKVFSK